MLPVPSIPVPLNDDDDDYLVLDLPSTIVIPTSSARDDPLLPALRSPLLPTHTPISALSHTSHTSPTVPISCRTSYPTHVTSHRYVAPGVLENGALTITHPDVRNFLAKAHTEPPPPPPSHRPIFVLVALALFYHPKKPAHWLFWSKDKRNETAKIVHAALNTSHLVYSPISWLGISENLNIVSNLQFGWREYLSVFPWFAPYAESKPSSSSPHKTRMNLRKRKQSQQDESSSSPLQRVIQELPNASTTNANIVDIAISDTADDVDVDVDVDAALTPPPKKRQRHSRAEQQAPTEVVPSETLTTRSPVRLNQALKNASTPCQQVRASERQKARKAAAEAAALLNSKPTTSTSPTAQSALSSRESSRLPSESSTVFIDSSWPCLFIPCHPSPDPSSPSDVSAVTLVEFDMNMMPVETTDDVDLKPTVVAGDGNYREKSTRKAKVKATKQTRKPSRASARRDKTNGERARVVASNATSRAKKDIVELEKGKDALTTKPVPSTAATMKTEESSVIPARLKKKARRRR